MSYNKKQKLSVSVFFFRDQINLRIYLPENTILQLTACPNVQMTNIDIIVVLTKSEHKSIVNASNIFKDWNGIPGSNNRLKLKYLLSEYRLSFLHNNNS